MSSYEINNNISYVGNDIFANSIPEEGVLDINSPNFEKKSNYKIEDRINDFNKNRYRSTANFNEKSKFNSF